MNRNEQGNILIYAMLVIAAVLGTTVVISGYIGSSIRQAGYLNNAQAAYLVAESGMEKVLYDVRQGSPLLLGECADEPGQCEFEVQEQMVDELTFNLDEGKVFQFDLYDPMGGAFSGAGVDSMQFLWEGNGWLEVSFVEIMDFEDKSWPGEMDPSYQQNLSAGGQVINNFFVVNKSYRLQVRAIYGDVKNLRVRAYSQDGAFGMQRFFADFVRVDINGEFSGANKALSFDMSRLAPPFDTLDYVKLK